MPERSEIVKPDVCGICGAMNWGPVAFYEGKPHCADCVDDREGRVKPILDWPLIRDLVKLFRA